MINNNINGKKKPTKKFRVEKSREIIQSYDVDVEFSANDVLRLNELLESSFRKAKRMVNPRFSNDPSHLWVVEDSGGWKSISWRNRVKEKSTRQEMHKAMRTAVQEDIEAFRLFMPEICSAEGCQNSDDLTVDHTPAFSHIADQFIATMGSFDLKKVEGVGVVFEHDHIESLWRKYHQAIATYSCLCRSCNSRKGAR